VVLEAIEAGEGATVAIDRKVIEFQRRLFSVAKEEFQASCHQPEARVFVQALYEAYLETGPPEDIFDWLRRRLQNEFRCVSSRPVWVDEEPAWPFHDGKPMIFVTQIDLPKNAVTEKDLTWDTVLYLFGKRAPGPDGDRLVFTEVLQERGIHGTGDR
jgi:hypothetical protein